MAALDSFKQPQAIKPVASLAAKHNRLADLIASMVGTNGVKVTVSEGRILIELDRDTGGSALGGGGSSTSGDVVQQIIASGGVFSEWTFCDSGSPATEWWPSWPSDPS